MTSVRLFLCGATLLVACGSDGGVGTDAGTKPDVSNGNDASQGVDASDAGTKDAALRRADADQARRRDRQGEPHLRQLLRLASPAPKARRTCKHLATAIIAVPARARQHAARPLPRARLRAHRLERRQDGRLGRRRRLDARTATTSPTRSTTRTTSRTTGRTRSTSRSAITSSPNVLGPSFPGHIVRARRAGGLGDRQPEHADHCTRTGAAIRRAQHDASPIAGPEHVHREAGLPVLQDPDRARRAARAASTGSSTARTSTCLPEIWSMFNARRRDPQRPGVEQRRQRSTVRRTTSQNNTLPDVSWLVNQDLADEHPDIGGVCAGENWTVRHDQPDHAERLLEGHRHPLHDGRLRRLVRPRAAAAPVRLRRAQPYGLGFRLPLIVISPYAKPGFIFKEVSRAGVHPALHREDLRRARRRSTTSIRPRRTGRRTI